VKVSALSRKRQKTRSTHGTFAAQQEAMVGAAASMTAATIVVMTVVMIVVTTVGMIVVGRARARMNAVALVMAVSGTVMNHLAEQLIRQMPLMTIVKLVMAPLDRMRRL